MSSVKDRNGLDLTKAEDIKKKWQEYMLGAGALGQPRGMVRRGRSEQGSGWGTRVYLWQIHVDIWQNNYNIVK